MHKLILLILLIFPVSFHAETLFTLKETNDVFFEEISSQNRYNIYRFTVDYVNDNNTSGSVRTACWGSFDDMKNQFYGAGLNPYAETFNDGKLAINSSSTTLSFNQGQGVINGYAYFRAVSGFNDETWTLYCSAVSNTSIPFRPREVSYTIVNLKASSIAYPSIIAPAIVDLKKCLPNNPVEATIPLTVGFIGYAGQNRSMDLTVKSSDLPESFQIIIDEENILNTLPHIVNIPSGQKEKKIESYLKGICPSVAGEYLWNAEYIYTIH